MTVYAFYIMESALSQHLKDTLEIDMDKDRILEEEIERGVILYAWTKKKSDARAFQAMRSKRFYRMKLKFDGEHCKDFEEFERDFGEREIYLNKLASRNTSLVTNELTVDIYMMTTSFESHHVDRYWEGMDEDFYDMFKEQEEGDKLYYTFYNILKPKYQKALDTLSYLELLDECIIWLEEGRYNNGIMLDEFAIFMDTYGETF